MDKIIRLPSDDEFLEFLDSVRQNYTDGSIRHFGCIYVTGSSAVEDTVDNGVNNSDDELGICEDVKVDYYWFCSPPGGSLAILGLLRVLENVVMEWMKEDN